ncbi:hypothetical protein ACI6Q2_18520 [Chitinophagaceae bacterium LWZ2-11]
MTKEIHDLISSNFKNEEEVFEGEFGGSSPIRKAIIEFTKKYGIDHYKLLCRELRVDFPNFKIDSYFHTQFQDRCISIYASKETGLYVEHYMIGISIFNYFMIFRQDYNKIEKSYDDPYYHPDLPFSSVFDDRTFLNEGESLFADEIFNATKQFYPELAWLPKDILTTTIRSLNIFSDRIQEDRIVYDLLFTSN